jgi:hypothetical protein
MEETCEQNDYRMNPKTNFTISDKKRKINWMSIKEMGKKYKTVIGHLT